LTFSLDFFLDVFAFLLRPKTLDLSDTLSLIGEVLCDCQFEIKLLGFGAAASFASFSIFRREIEHLCRAFEEMGYCQPSFHRRLRVSFSFTLVCRRRSTCELSFVSPLVAFCGISPLGGSPQGDSTLFFLATLRQEQIVPQESRGTFCWVNACFEVAMDFFLQVLPFSGKNVSFFPRTSKLSRVPS